MDSNNRFNMSSESGMTPPGGSAVGDVCIPNISTAERRKRLMSGVVILLIGLVILGALMAFGASRWWRLILFPLFAGAGSGFFQWRDKT
jgi:hypothetical protein